ncbi:MAG: transposase [Clostridia bacterium]
MAKQTRKINRLQGYDYSQNGAYFVTICVKNHECILGEITDGDEKNVGETCGLPNIIIFEYGKIIEDEIQKIPNYYHSEVIVEKYIIMPNHVHMIIRLDNSGANGRPQVSPTIPRIMQQFKGKITKQLGFSIWQRSYHDHIIRNEKEYEKIWQYIDTNAFKWNDDIYYKI